MVWKICATNNLPISRSSVVISGHLLKTMFSNRCGSYTFLFLTGQLNWDKHGNPNGLQRKKDTTFSDKTKNEEN